MSSMPTMSSILGHSSRRNARQPNDTSSIPDASRRESSSDDTWEELDISSTEYASRRRELMQLINDLRSLGASTMIDLPSIVVIGGQSAGKSSLVEAVSGVNVPRDSGTCTRCPMDCTISSSATTWSCKISLRFDYDSSGKSAAASDLKVVSFGPTITDRAQVEIWLRRAQAAILNPDLPLNFFHTKSVQELRNFTSPNTLKFSRNVVSISIEDPGATDLSFVDLPGLIQNEEQGVVDLVRELTESYIKRANAIILTTIPMSDDMQNQLSVKLGKAADPDGERTIGILTKPDMLGDGDVNAKKTWASVIEGHKYPLKHGYYCVRLPNDAQRAQRLSRSALQQIAAEYFDTTSPWKEVTQRGRFGIPAFVTDISVLLVKHINRVIPQLRQDVERLLAACLEELGTLPKPPEADPQLEVFARVNAFCDAFKGVVSGTSSDKELAQRNRALYAGFSQEIRATAPDFRPFENSGKYKQIDALDSEEESKLRDDRVAIMGVYEVRKTILESIAWELPGNVPYEAKTRLIHQFTTLWSTPAQKCLASINDVLDDVIQKLALQHFGRFNILHGLVLDLIRPDIEERKNGVRDAVKETLELETNPTYTQNLTDFENLRGGWLSKYRKARRRPEEYLISSAFEDCADGYPGVECAQEFVERVTPSPRYVYTRTSVADVSTRNVSPEQQALNYLSQAGYRGLTVEDLARLHPPDQFEEELIVMADVRAYFTIAYKRIVDHIFLKTEHTLHQALAERLSASLLQRLLADAISSGNFADRMKELVSEDPATEAKRTQLQALRTRLQEMRRKLVSFSV